MFRILLLLFICGYTQAKSSLSEYMAFAEKGDPHAQYQLARAYLYGEGVKKDVKKAFELLEKAREHKHSKSIYLLGREYNDGTNVPQDLEKARLHFEQASEMGHPKATHQLAWMHLNGEGGFEKNIQIAIVLAEKAGSQGHIPAWFLLGRLFYDDKGEIPQDLERSFKYFEHGAKQGSASAQHQLAWMLARGEGAPINFKKSRNLLHRAAEQEHAPAQHLFALIHLNGEGVKKNIPRGVHWLKRAAGQGYKNSLVALQDLEDRKIIQLTPEEMRLCSQVFL